jgi:hypothetical protein
MTWAKLTPSRKERERALRKERTKSLRLMRQEQRRAEQDANDAKSTACWKWDRALNGRQFETLIMKDGR